MPLHRYTVGRVATLALAGVFGVGCGSSFWTAPAPAPAEIPRLEERLARDSADARAPVRLSEAYRRAGRVEDARRLLEWAVERHPDEPTPALLLGLTYEELERYADARRLYRTYAESGSSPRLRTEVARRLPLLQRLELRAGVQQAVAREDELANAPPEPWTVAVLPFDFVGRDPELRPLGRALAEMLVTDLSETDRLRVLERAQVQALLDEMRLEKSGLVDPATARRTGRLLKAERVVGGSMDDAGASLRLETAIVRVTDTPWPGEAPSEPEQPNVLRLSESDELRALFEMETRLALRIYASLGVELTPAERERVTRRKTENLMALLAYGRGLEAEDAWDFAAAARHFAESASLDPSFTQARDAAARASGSAAAASVDTRQLASRAEAGAAAAASEPPMPDPLTRDAAAEVLRLEGIGAPTLIEFILRRP